MSHTHQLFTLIFLSLLLCARLHFSDFFSRATQRAPVLPPTRCKLPQKKGIYGGTGGLYVYVFLTVAALRLYICFVVLGARISATYQGFIAFLYLFLLQAHLYLFIFWQCFTSCIFHFYLSIS